MRVARLVDAGHSFPGSGFVWMVLEGVSAIFPPGLQVVTGVFSVNSISSLRKGLDMVTWFLSKETKSHAQAHKRGYSNNSI